MTFVLCGLLYTVLSSTSWYCIIHVLYIIIIAHSFFILHFLEIICVQCILSHFWKLIPVIKSLIVITIVQREWV